MTSKKQANNDEFLMVTDVARILNRSAESVRNYARSGKLPAIRTANGHRLFKRQDVLKFASSQKGN